MKKLKILALIFVLSGTGFIAPHASAAEDFHPYLEGYGTEESPLLIHTEEDLLFVRELMEKREDITIGKYFRLTADIRLNDRVLDDDGSLLEADTAGMKKWIPIGYGETLRPYHAFRGNFDGNGHTISGIYINEPGASDRGFFGYIHKDGVVRNLRIADSYIYGSEAVGAVCGHCHDGQVINCESSASVISTGASLQAGGIAGVVDGYDGRLLSCRNYGKVTGVSAPNEYGELYNCYTGGICGQVSSATVDSCTNAGVVLADGWGAVGGITGTVTGGGSVRGSIHKGYVSSTVGASIGGIAGNNWQTVSGCTNEGSVVATTEKSNIGGIVGTSSFNSRIYNSSNKADIICILPNVNLGGIVGNMDGGREYDTYYTPMVYTSVNEGTIQTTDASSRAGGISGKNYCAEIHSCENRGLVISASTAGGISPLCEFHSNISGCGNSGTVEAADYAGGIVGDTNGSVDNSWNTGNILNSSDNGDAGGIAGYTSGSIRYCFNTGEISHATKGGGIAGNNASRSHLSNCYNAGYIHTSNTSATIGGLGGGNGSVTNSYNTGTVCADGDNSTAGGLVYNTWQSFDSHGNRSGSRVENSYNAGSVCATGTGCALGNIAGSYNYSDASGLFRNCYYLEDMLHGEGYTCDDTKNTYLTAIGPDALKNLTPELNVKDWWDETPDAFVQGYGRPVFNVTGADNAHMAFRVATLGGDSVYVDLGAPVDNMFFTSPDTGMVLDAYNVINNDTVRRAMLVDGHNLTIDKPVEARTLTYIRNLANTVQGAACLPFILNSDDLPAGMTVIQPLRMQDNGSMLINKVEHLQAGEPFLFYVSEGIEEWSVTKQNVKILPEPADTSLLRGTFCGFGEWTSGCYLPSDERSVYRPAQMGEVIPAFRAYIKADESSYDTIILTENEISAVPEMRAPAVSVTASGRNIVVKNAGGKAVGVFSAAGTCIFSPAISKGDTVIPVNEGGVYIVTADGLASKVLVK